MNNYSYVDFETSINTFTNGNFDGFHFHRLYSSISPYRIWVRYNHSNWEVRAGLQKINFGSAKIFRPLMWFDAIDVRDPLHLTDGVYALLGKYYFDNNANLWLWSLLGNEKFRGYETYHSDKWTPEIGG